MGLFGTLKWLIFDHREKPLKICLYYFSSFLLAIKNKQLLFLVVKEKPMKIMFLIFYGFFLVTEN
jgi:hypothetical protein